MSKQDNESNRPWTLKTQQPVKVAQTSQTTTIHTYDLTPPLIEAAVASERFAILAALSKMYRAGSNDTSGDSFEAGWKDCLDLVIAEIVMRGGDQQKPVATAVIESGRKIAANLYRGYTVGDS